MRDCVFIPCRKCSQLKGPKPGFYFSRMNGYDVVVECNCHKHWRESLELDRKLLDSNIQPDYSFSDYRGETSREDLNALIHFTNNFKKYSYKTMLYLWGKNGCQKTSMAQACAKEIVTQGFTVQYVVMNNLINSLITKENQEDNLLVKRCLDVDLLIIDESFDSKKVTLYKSGYQIPYLDNFLRQRFEIDKKSIMFVSNKMPNEIEKEGFDYSIQNLVERNTRNSLLKFEDVYFDQVGVGIPDRLGLFK